MSAIDEAKVEAGRPELAPNHAAYHGLMILVAGGVNPTPTRFKLIMGSRFGQVGFVPTPKFPHDPCPTCGFKIN